MTAQVVPIRSVDVLVNSEIDRMVSEAIHLLASDERVFVRAGQLMRVVYYVETIPAPSRKAARAPIATGTPVIATVDSPVLRQWLSGIGNWYTMTETEEGIQKRKTKPPLDVVAAVVAQREYHNLRPLSAIVETPILRPDGTVLDTPGYDYDTACIYIPPAGVEFPRVASAPTQSDASSAMRLILEVVENFPFVSVVDRAAWVAKVLTMVSNTAIPGNVPVFNTAATSPGTGKSLLEDAAFAIVTGRPAAKKGWPADEIELKKVLGAYGLSGTPFICFDNADGAVDSDELNMLVSCNGSYSLRVLGRSETPLVRYRPVVSINGNNCEPQKALIRRTIMIRLASDRENPTDRPVTDFKHPDLLGWIAAERPRLVHACLTIIRGWFVAGKPQPESAKTSFASFEGWQRIIPAAVAWAAGPEYDVMAARLDAAACDTDLDHLRSLLRWWRKTDQNNRGKTSRSVLAELWPPGERNLDESDQFVVDAREAITALTDARSGCAPTSHAFGLAIRAAKGRVVNVDGQRCRLAAKSKKQPTSWEVECIQ